MHAQDRWCRGYDMSVLQRSVGWQHVVRCSAAAGGWQGFPGLHWWRELGGGR
jgi:hypothetical protein